MKTFLNSAAQGDVHFTRRDALPLGLKAVDAVKGQIVVTHSETGHNHVMVLDRADDMPAVQMFTGDDPLIAWLQVNRPTALEHLRPHDTHEPIMFAPGVYEVRRQREYSPEGFRRVED
jgi:hypothetical protein